MLCLMLFAPMCISICAAEESGNCEALRAAVNQAQTAYNKALGAWKQATVKVIQAEQAVTNVKDRIKTNDKTQIQVIRDLQAAEADQAACANNSQNGPLAPLVDCAKVQGRGLTRHKRTWPRLRQRTSNWKPSYEIRSKRWKTVQRTLPTPTPPNVRHRQRLNR